MAFQVADLESGKLDTNLAFPIEAMITTATQYADVSELVDHLIRTNTNFAYVVKESRLSCEKLYWLESASMFSYNADPVNTALLSPGNRSPIHF